MASKPIAPKEWSEIVKKLWEQAFKLQIGNQTNRL